jgi:hypothetical protein
MERFSILQESKLVPDRPILLSSKSSKEAKIKKIYRAALGANSGQLEELGAQHEFSNEVLNLAQEIKGFVERLAIFIHIYEGKRIKRSS